MDKICLISISLGFLFLLHGCIANESQQQQQQGECQIQRLNAQEPTSQLKSEGGITEYWNFRDQQFQCAGVSVLRHVINRKGLLVPSYTDAPLLVFIQQGEGYLGVILPGCPETFQSSQQSEQEHGQQGQKFKGDRHQKIRHFRRGDVLAIPAGVAHWLYNTGDQDLVAIVLFDTSNEVNQLTNRPRRFLIGGNPEGQNYQHKERSGNIFWGMDVKIIAESFNVNQETARKVKADKDKRGIIITIEGGLRVTTPPLTREEKQQGQQESQQQGESGSGNGLEETICSARLRENLDDPARADIYNPQAGRLSSLNGNNLPILRNMRLSAERGFLHRNAIMAPHWNVNAHSIIYVTKGEARIQVINHKGQAVFDGQLKQGQILVVPQNFAVVKQAGNQGFEWVAFKTNDNAIINTLAGRTSVFRGLPVSVIANAYQIDVEEAQKLKNNRLETILFSGQGRRSSEGEGGKIMDVVENAMFN